MLHLPEGYKRQPLPGKKAWVAALRSGKYKQGKGALHEGDFYCCLGVLCTIQKRPTLPYGAMTYFDGKGAILSPKNPCAAALGSFGTFPEHCFVRIKEVSNIDYIELTGLNDKGLTFPQIADIIDAVWYDEQEEQP